MNSIDKMHEQHIRTGDNKISLHTLSGTAISKAPALMCCFRMRRRERRLNNSL